MPSDNSLTDTEITKFCTTLALLAPDKPREVEATSAATTRSLATHGLTWRDLLVHALPKPEAPPISTCSLIGRATGAPLSRHAGRRRSACAIGTAASSKRSPDTRTGRATVSSTSSRRASATSSPREAPHERHQQAEEIEITRSSKGNRRTIGRRYFLPARNTRFTPASRPCRSGPVFPPACCRGWWSKNSATTH